jgi:hypothetical protein
VDLKFTSLDPNDRQHLKKDIKLLRL